MPSSLIAMNAIGKGLQDFIWPKILGRGNGEV